MIFEIEINNKPVKVKKGETIKSVLDRIGIKVPTLCSMKDFTPTGMCRMCVVEIEGRENLIPSCSFKVEEWMKIKTHSPRVIKARKTIVELLLADHPDDCLYCERNGDCELQNHAEDLHVRERRISGHKAKHNIDKSSVAIVKESAKCILCGRCVRVCNEVIGVSTFDFTNRGIRTSVQTSLNKAMNSSNCINCGQCILVCPTAALTERIHFSDLEGFLHDPVKKMVALYSPSISITLAEEFGIKPGKDMNGIINAVLRKIGFDRVIDAAFGADIMIMEQAQELLSRLKNGGPFPLFSSCCPSWVKYAEQYNPELLPNISSTKSPQQIMGALIKTYFTEKENIASENIHTVAIMPCTARKFEAMRPEMTQFGITEVDSVLTTRELARLIRMYGIDVASIEPEPPDSFLSNQSSAGKLVNVSGGTAEAAVRSFYSFISGKEMDDLRLTVLRGSKAIKETQIKIGKLELGVAVVNGMGNFKGLMEQIANGRTDIHYVEVMACPGGCIAGGGQPVTTREDALKIRTRSIYDLDDKEQIRVAHKNPQITELYATYLGVPLEESKKSLLHTTYTKRKVLL
jgi:iron-only hydrogenase group A